MAEGLARWRGKEFIEVHSAGIDPKGLNPLAITVMDEVGIDIRNQKSKGIDYNLIRRVNWVITVCGNAEELCPSLPATIRKKHWRLKDPAAAGGNESERLRVFKKVRDELTDRIRDFFTTIGI